MYYYYFFYCFDIFLLLLFLFVFHSHLLPLGFCFKKVNFFLLTVMHIVCLKRYLSLIDWFVSKNYFKYNFLTHTFVLRLTVIYIRIFNTFCMHDKFY